MSSKSVSSGLQRVVSIEIRRGLSFSASSEVDKQLMVCSHERSGTHFLMNTIGLCTHYCANPWLNYDLNPLGTEVNFYSENSARNFIKQFGRIRTRLGDVCNASIIKSHFPLALLGENTSELPLKVLYVYRNPYDTLVSLWRFMHQWDWNEGPKLSTPLALATATPSGQSQRYQLSNYKDYFERWAAHVLDGISYCQRNTNAHAVSYEELVANHASRTIKACEALGIGVVQTPVLPSRSESVIQGKMLELIDSDAEAMRKICDNRLADYPELQSIFRDSECS